jgi:putative selenium metabolism protein SsnA
MIITNATIITWDTERPLCGYDVFIDGTRISKIAPHSNDPEGHAKEQVFDAGGKILMPGLICAHTHFYGLFSRGLGIPGEAPHNFSQILEKLWWPLDSSLTTEDVKLSAMVCLVDAIKHGTTTLFDHHASPMCIDGSLSQIGQAFIETGVRGSVCYEATDRYGLQLRDGSIDENLRMLAELRSHPNDLLEATFGIHASLTVSDETLEKIKFALPEHTGVHIHVAEDQVDEDDSLEKYGKRVVERLDAFGLLGPNSILVHGVHLNEAELELIQKSNTWITHQPRSNMNNAVGMADVEKMVAMGIKVCLGNDGFSNAMWDEWRTAYLVHKLWHKDPTRMNGNLLMQIAVQNNADFASHFFHGKKIGRIIPGYQADLILVDYLSITEMNQHNIPWHILFGFRDSMVTDTMVNGKWLMNDRKLTHIDEAQLAKQALEHSKSVWKRYNSKFN